MGKFILLFLISTGRVLAEPYPIQFAVPESKIVADIPEKALDFAFIVPGRFETYIYKVEEDYYKDYQRSYFALTYKKSGWDCMRHYEILANGCIPYFVGLEQCHPKTMQFLPRELILEAMNLPGVAYPKIDHEKFDKAKYNEILGKMLEHTRKYLTTRNMAKYVLDTIKYSGNGKILFLSQDPSPDYLRCLMLIGMKELFGERIIDFPKIEHIYKSYSGDLSTISGKGFTFTKIIDDLNVDRSSIAERIAKKEFDIVIYGSVHRGLLFHDLVLQNYEKEKIAYLCGEDCHHCSFANLHNFFLREFDSFP